jgi:hypothetical protein
MWPVYLTIFLILLGIELRQLRPDWHRLQSTLYLAVARRRRVMEVVPVVEVFFDYI